MALHPPLSPLTHHWDNVTAPHGRPNLRSRLHSCHAQEGGPRSPQKTSGGIGKKKSIQHEMRVNRIFIRCLSGTTISFHFISKMTRFSEKIFENKICFDFLYNNSHSKTSEAKCYQKCMLVCNVPLFLFDFKDA